MRITYNKGGWFWLGLLGFFIHLLITARTLNPSYYLPSSIWLLLMIDIKR